MNLVDEDKYMFNKLMGENTIGHMKLFVYYVLISIL